MHTTLIKITKEFKGTAATYMWGESLQFSLRQIKRRDVLKHMILGKGQAWLRCTKYARTETNCPQPISVRELTVINLKVRERLLKSLSQLIVPVYQTTLNINQTHTIPILHCNSSLSLKTRDSVGFKAYLFKATGVWLSQSARRFSRPANVSITASTDSSGLPHRLSPTKSYTN